jgi:allophanate hydrolase subunit 1
LLTDGGIASWGGILMVPLFATVVAISLTLSQRVASQKQALAQMVNSCRQEVDAAYRSLQVAGRIQGIQMGDLLSALALLWESGDADAVVGFLHTLEETRKCSV